MRDPNPLVSGKGFDELRAHGIEVEVGVLEDEAARLNRAFAIVQTEGRPMVIAKAATSIDSRIAAAPGVRTQLTSAEANRRTQRLRAAVDADRRRLGHAAGRRSGADGARLLSPAAAGARGVRSPVAHSCNGAAVLDARRGAGHNSDNCGRRQPATLRRAAGTDGGGRHARSKASGDLRQDLRALVPFDISTLLLEGGARHARRGLAGRRHRSRARDRRADGARRGRREIVRRHRRAVVAS